PDRLRNGSDCLDVVCHNLRRPSHDEHTGLRFLLDQWSLHGQLVRLPQHLPNLLPGCPPHGIAPPSGTDTLWIQASSTNDFFPTVAVNELTQSEELGAR